MHRCNAQSLNHPSEKLSPRRRRHTGGVGGQIFWLLLSQSGRGEKVLSLLAAFSRVAYFAYVKGVS